MSDLSHAVNLIRKYEGYSEKAYPDPITGEEPYTIGFGTQFYPDGSPVKRGQCCTREKALEYLAKAVDLRLMWGWHDFLEINPIFEKLWDDPEFKALVKRAQDEKAAIRAQVQEMIDKGEIDL